MDFLVSALRFRRLEVDEEDDDDSDALFSELNRDKLNLLPVLVPLLFRPACLVGAHSEELVVELIVDELFENIELLLESSRLS